MTTLPSSSSTSTGSSSSTSMTQSLPSQIPNLEENKVKIQVPGAQSSKSHNTVVKQKSIND